MLVGPGNAIAGRASLFGRVDIDLFAGPDRNHGDRRRHGRCRACATDLLGQAEHGDSPAVLLTNSETLANDTLAEIDRAGILRRRTPHPSVGATMAR